MISTVLIPRTTAHYFTEKRNRVHTELLFRSRQTVPLMSDLSLNECNVLGLVCVMFFLFFETPKKKKKQFKKKTI